MKLKRISKVLLKIKRYFFGPKTEIQFVEAALQRYKDKLFNIYYDFDPQRDCCIDCMTGGYETKLKEKITRVEHRLKILKQGKKIVK